MWVRGLKQDNLFTSIQVFKVAPRVGAWIETLSTEITFRALSVAPRVGAWIETTHKLINLKNAPVAPRVGSWI